MEANKVPEKIYLHPDLDSIFGMTERSCESEIEYIRTDAFIKKASFWLECNLSDRPMEDRKFWVEDFINYMIGE